VDGLGFLLKRRADNASAKPNPAHIALAELEQRIGDRFFLCTQNVDDLHERAGSVRLIHMHGELNKAHCERDCGRPPVEDRSIYASLSEVGHCPCGGRLRPHIVFFGEIPYEMDRIQEEIGKATLMLVVGTSGSVYRQPASYTGPGKTEPAPSTSAPSRRSTPQHLLLLWKQRREALPGLFQVQ